MANFETATIDGQPVMRRIVSVTAADGWDTAKDTAINYMALGETTEYFYNDFSDSNEVSGSGFELDATNKCLKNTASTATPGGSLLPVFVSTDNDGDGHSYTTSEGYNISSVEAGYTSLYGGFNGVTSDTSGGNNFLGWTSTSGGVTILLPSTQTISGYKGFTYYSASFYPNKGWGTWTVYGTTDGGSTWFEIESKTGFNSWPSSSVGYEFTFSTAQTVNGLKFTVASNAGGTGTYLTELQILGAGTAGGVDEAVITLDPYVPAVMPDVCKMRLWLKDLDNTGAIDIGTTGNNALEFYASTDSGGTWSNALSFTPAELQPAPNIYVFDGPEIDTSTATAISGKLQSFDRGDGAPNFEWHAFVILQKQ